MSDQSAAELSLELGAMYPYDAPDDWKEDDKDSQPPPAKDWAHRAARGILSDLTDRRGIKHGFNNIDEDVRVELVGSLAAIIRQAAEESAIGGRVMPPKYVVELQPNCWIANWLGDPGRTLRLGNARMFPTRRAAVRGLQAAREFRPFKQAVVLSLREAREKLKKGNMVTQDANTKDSSE